MKLKMKMRITPSFKWPKTNEIFVFGSNTEGRHGKGAALFAKTNCGAIYGQAKGLQGNSYAIITKNLKIGNRSVSLKYIAEQIKEFIDYAIKHPKKRFYVAPIGCGHAGYKIEEIAPLFLEAKDVLNIYLPQEFWKVIYKEKPSD